MTATSHGTRTLVHRNRAGTAHEIRVGSFQGCRRCTATLAGFAVGWLVGTSATLPAFALVLVFPVAADLVRTRVLGGQQIPWIVSASSFIAGLVGAAWVSNIWRSSPGSTKVLLAGAFAVVAAAVTANRQSGERGSR